jgi:RNA-binding protein
MEPLEPAQRRALRAKAHHLDPIVTVGHHGLTPSVRREIDVALNAHELVKVRVLGDDREAREALLARVCRELDCAPVQRIGKLLVLFRPRPADAMAKPASTAKSAAPTSTQRAGKSQTRRPAPRAPRGVPRAALPRRRRGV